MVTLPFDPLEVRKSERGIYRLYQLDLAAEQVTALLADEHVRATVISRGLNIEKINGAHIQVLTLKELEELGVTGYLKDGLGLPEATFAADAEMLDELRGYVAVVASAAFEGPVTLTPNAPLSLVAAYAEPEADLGFVDTTASSNGTADEQADAEPYPPNESSPAFKWVMGLIVIAFIASAVIYQLRLS